MVTGLSAAYIRQKLGQGLITLEQFKFLRLWLSSLIKSKDEEFINSSINKTKTDKAVGWAQMILYGQKMEGRKYFYRQIQIAIKETEQARGMFDALNDEYKAATDKNAFWESHKSIDKPIIRKAFEISELENPDEFTMEPQQIIHLLGEDSISIPFWTRDKLINNLKKLKGVVITDNRAKIVDGKDVIVWRFDKKVINYYLDSPSGRKQLAHENVSYEFIYESFRIFSLECQNA